MKKVTNILSLSTLFLSAFFPAILGVADTRLKTTTQTDSAIVSSSDNQSNQVVADPSSSISLPPTSDEEKNTTKEAQEAPGVSPRILQGDPYGFWTSHVTSHKQNIPELSGTDWKEFSQVGANLKFQVGNVSSGILQPSTFSNYKRLTGELVTRITYNGVSVDTSLMNLPLEDYQNSSNWSQTYADSINLETSLFVPTIVRDTDILELPITINPDNKMYITESNFTTSDTLSTSRFPNAKLTINGASNTTNVSQVSELGSNSFMGWSNYIGETLSGPSNSLKSDIIDSFKLGDNIEEILGDITNLIDGDTTGVSYSWAINPLSNQLGENHGVIVATGSNGYKTFINYIYEVVQDHTAINVHDSTVYVGDAWQAVDNFDNATASDGTPLDYTTFISTGGTVEDYQLNTNTAGSYPVMYTLNGVTTIANITVKAKQTAVNIHDSSIYVGDTWKAEDNFDSALDKDGNNVDYSKITVDYSKVDTSTPGTYDVTYSYDGITSMAQVTVKAKQTAVNVHDSTIYVGDNWTAQDNFDSALDKDGNAVDFSQITVDDSKINTSKAGAFDVTYIYDGITSSSTVTVLDKASPENPKYNEENSDTPKVSNSDNISTSGNHIPHNNNDKVKIQKLEKVLPQTGSSNGTLLNLIGLAILFFLVLFVLLKYKPRIK